MAEEIGGNSYHELAISLDSLSSDTPQDDIEQLIASLDATTTLKKLALNFDDFEATAENNRLLIQPLCRCIANLRRHNPNHRLRTLDIDGAEEDACDVVAQFLVAAKELGIHTLSICSSSLRILSLVEFCRDNTPFKVLRIFHTNLYNAESSISVLSQDGPLDSSVIATLDLLHLYDVYFHNSTAATKWTAFLAHINVFDLILGEVTARLVEEQEVEGFDLQIAERILSELTFPSVEHLDLQDDCKIEHFHAALVAGMATVTELTVRIPLDRSDTTAKLESLASMIRGASQLNRLTLHTLWEPATPETVWWRPLDSALTDACVTLTRMDVTPTVNVPELQAIAERNRELARCIANPSIYYRSNQLPELMVRFDTCPTGRYLLVRCLPGILSFEKIQSVTNRKRKNMNDGVIDGEQK